MQFFYDREEVVGKSEDKTTDLTETRKDSFNPEMVIRSYEYVKGKITIILSDGHEEAQEVPQMNSKRQITGYKRERSWVTSQIFLNENDTKRYREYFDIEPHMLLQKGKYLLEDYSQL